MNFLIEIKVCRICLKPDESTKLTEYDSSSEIMTNFTCLVQTENNGRLPKTFCDKCVSKLKISSDFKRTCLASEKYLLDFMSKISMEFQKSLPVAPDTDDDDDENYDSIKSNLETCDPQPITTTKVVIPATEKATTPTKSNVFKHEKNENTESVLIDLESSSAVFNEEEQQQQELIDDNDAEIYNQHEIYDIMEVEDHEALENAGDYEAEGDNEFIYVNFKSTEDGEEDDEEDEEMEDDETTEPKYFVEQMYEQDAKKTASKKKNVKVPKDLIEKYAQTVDPNQHVCTKCIKVFSTRTNLIRHIQSHDGNKPYVCDVCSKGFTQSGSLKQHMYIHTGERPYKCTFCERCFTQGKSLKFHLRRHTEEKPHLCEVCQVAFRQKDGLKRHMKTRHNIDMKTEKANDKIIGFVDMEDDDDQVDGLKRQMKTRHNIDMKTEKANDKIMEFVDMEDIDDRVDDEENVD